MIKEPHPLSIISYVVLLMIVGVAALFSVKDCLFILRGGFREGLWEYLILFAVLDFVFIVLLLPYLFQKKWTPLLFAVGLGIVMNLSVSFSNSMPVALFVISVAELAVIIVFRKKLLY